MRAAVHSRQPSDLVSSYTTGGRLRSCEWALVAFFVYVAGISLGFHMRSSRHVVPFAIAGGALGVLAAFALAEQWSRHWRVISMARDWLTLGLVLAAYREMDWFTPKIPDHRLDDLWISWDRWLLHDLGVQRAIEFLGAPLPGLLELSYLLVYATGPFVVAALYFARRRFLVGRVLFVYVVGTVAAYALFPYFPSSPPRAVFPGMDMPAVTTSLRNLNLVLVGGYGIHSSVFPSAHVSSAFSAAWALLMYLPENRRVGWGMLVYAVVVAIATVYGRYHYAVDALAGIGISLGAAGLAWILHPPERAATPLMRQRP